MSYFINVPYITKSIIIKRVVVFTQSHIPHIPVYSINEYNYQKTRGLPLSRAGSG